MGLGPDEPEAPEPVAPDVPAELGARAVVVQLLDYGESDRVVHLLTRMGRLASFAPGARRSKKRFGGALEPLGSVRPTLDARKKAGMPMLLEAEVVAPRLALRTSLEALALGAYAAELAWEVSPEGHEAADVLALLEGLLDRLQHPPFVPALRRVFELHLALLLGYAPVLDACVRCGRVEPEATWVDLEEGGLLCAEHRGRAVELGPKTLTWARALVAAFEAGDAFAEDGAAGLDADWREPAALRLGRALDRFWPTILARPLRAEAWLLEVLGQRRR